MPLDSEAARSPEKREYEHSKSYEHTSGEHVGYDGYEALAEKMNVLIDEHKHIYKCVEKIGKKLYKKLKKLHEEHEEIEDELEDEKMSIKDDVSIIGVPTGGHGGYGYGDGFGGGGILGAVLVAALLGNRGGFGFGGNAGFVGEVGGCHNRCATTDDVMDAQQLGILADIRAAVPLSESQLQLALAQAQDAITTQTLEQTISLKDGQTAIQLANANTLYQLSAQLSAGNFALSNEIHEEGEKTRQLITNNQIMELNRLAAERQDEIIELRNERRRDTDRHGLEINMINNQNQNQLQFQAQAQAQAVFFDQFRRDLFEVSQIAKATNAQFNIGSGTLNAATQTANPINTKI